MHEAPADPIPKERNIRRRQILESGRTIVTVTIDGPSGKTTSVRFRFLNRPHALQAELLSVIEAWGSRE